MADEILRPDGRPVELKELGFTLVSKTLSARVETFPATAPGTRSGGSGLTPVVMQSADVRELGTVFLQDAQPERAQEKQVQLYIPAGGPEDGRILLYIDENGGISFHLPQTDRQPPTGIRAGREGVLRFDVPIRPPIKEPTETAPVRGVGGMLAKKVLKVIGWKLVGAVARQVGPPLVRQWEAQYRPMRTLNRVHLFEPQAPPLDTLIPPSERALLFIHGTFSRVAAAFKGINTDVDFLARLQERYGEHIYGFDHATVATGVATNAMQFYEKLAPGVHNFDIICHSRGGLVARALRDLTEDQLKQCFVQDCRRGKYEAELEAWGKAWRIPDGVQVKVNRILFGGTPNNGTVLAQPTHLKKYLEILMTATNLLPEFVDVTVDAILTVAKLLLNDVMPELPGLDDQKPNSDLLKLLRNAPAPEDAAIEADYAPPAGLQAIMRTADAAIDFVFSQEQNDLVVPTIGVSRWPGGAFQQIRCLSFTADKSVHHSTLFLQADSRRQLWDWLCQ